MAAGSASPEALNDPNDLLRPELDEENSAPNPPLSKPTQDMEVTEEMEAGDDDDLSDNESILSEVDEAQFEDFDPANIAVEDKPIPVDESNVRLLVASKRKRAEDGEGGGKKKKREGRREKTRKSRKKRDGDDNLSGGEIEGKRSRKKSSKVQDELEEDEEHLTPEERRRRALDRAMDDAMRKSSGRRRKKGDIDLETMADAEIEDMRRRMSEAAEADTRARDRGEPAMHKLKMLPEVIALLNRNTLQNSLVDPDLNLLQAVRFFLEPLNDGSMPAYNIQRELFAALAKLPITKDALVASGIGKVVLFYTKSNRPEPGIKRQAEKLLAEWTRPILKRNDDFRKKEYAQADYDPLRLPVRPSQHASSQANAAAARERALAEPNRSNRARIESGPTSYTIVPRSTVVPSEGNRMPGMAGYDAFKKMRAKQTGGRR